MRIPKLLRPFLKPTAEEKTPTNMRLDNDIEYVSMILHHVWPILAKVVRRKIARFFRYRWKFVIGRIVMFAAVAVLAYYAFVKVFSVTVIHVRTHTTADTCTYYSDGPEMNLRNFLLQIAYTESRYDKTANRDSSQYWGLYQIGTAERRTAGYGDIPKHVYLNHAEIQDLCMIELLKYNRRVMQPYINSYVGKVVDGILVTESGILALSHVAGCGGAAGYLKSGCIPKSDQNGNPLRDFLKLGGYRLNLDDVKYSVQDAVNGKPTIKPN